MKRTFQLYHQVSIEGKLCSRKSLSSSFKRSCQQHFLYQGVNFSLIILSMKSSSLKSSRLLMLILHFRLFELWSMIFSLSFIINHRDVGGRECDWRIIARIAPLYLPCSGISGLKMFLIGTCFFATMIELCSFKRMPLHTYFKYQMKHAMSRYRLEFR